jgi:LPS export ABC transporter protein LptC
VYLNAEQGILNTETNDIEFSGDVVIRNEDYRLTTEQLNYVHGRRFIYTDVPVNISGRDAELSADSATFDLEANKIVLTGHVASVISRNFSPVQGLGKP